MVVKQQTVQALESLNAFNQVFKTSWQFGMNWNNSMLPQFKTYITDYLFPKINSTSLIDVPLGNRFDWLAKDVDFIGQLTEEYVFMDSIPTNMDLSKNEILMLKRNYPRIATKLYNNGTLKKQKFTLNNNDQRLNFRTLAEAVGYALGVFNKKISDINVAEEREIKAMLIDYSLNYTKEKRTVTSEQQLFNATFNAVLNIQNNSDKYNETNLASGGAIGRYTTVTSLKDIAILTNDKMKTYLLDTKLANTFNAEGIDLSKKIMSFDDLGGVYKTTADITIDDNALTSLVSMGDYQSAIGDIIPSGSVFTYDITNITAFKDKYIEIVPTSDLYSFIFDINGLKYERCTKDMLKPEFYNGEFDEVNYWIHYYSNKIFRPFFNKITIMGE